MLNEDEKSQLSKAISADETITAELKDKALSVLGSSSGYCTYNGSQYSPGSLICQAGKEMICDTGGSGNWFATGGSC